MENESASKEEFSEDPEFWPDSSAVQKEVEEVTDNLREATDQSDLSEKVETLRESLENLGQEFRGWRGQPHYLETIDGLKQQVDGIQQEWMTVSESMRLQRERLESLLQAFPGVIETSTLRALTMRLRHLEEVVSDLVESREHKISTTRTNKQLVISIVALIVSIISCGIFVLFRIFPPSS